MVNVQTKMKLFFDLAVDDGGQHVFLYEGKNYFFL